MKRTFTNMKHMGKWENGRPKTGRKRPNTFCFRAPLMWKIDKESPQEEHSDKGHEQRREQQKKKAREKLKHENMEKQPEMRRC